jgi:molybdopterin-biosynthesis enzyme MoeA-like protein
MKTPTFFALIIGTEILNRRRKDAHFDFITKALEEKGYHLSGAFIIEDDPALIVQTLKFIASQPNPVLFSFGGIGSTPDDHTRKCAAIALRDGRLYEHPEAKRIIEETLKERAYPHPVKMAQLPKGAKLLHNPVNNMPAFSLDDRYFFMPGFPEMSHPMVTHILKTIIPNGSPTYRFTLTAACRENEFIELMEQTPSGVEVSSLPKLSDNGWYATLSVASKEKEKAASFFHAFQKMLDAKQIDYTLDDTP